MTMQRTQAVVSKCPKCGAASLYRDDDGLACLCGYRKYESPAPTPVKVLPIIAHSSKPQGKDSNNEGWWSALGTTPDAIKEASAELGAVVMKQSQDKGLSRAEACIALRIVLMRLESNLEIKLSRSQKYNLNSFVHHLVGVK